MDGEGQRAYTKIKTEEVPGKLSTKGRGDILTWTQGPAHSGQTSAWRAGAFRGAGAGWPRPLKWGKPGYGVPVSTP